MVRSQCRRGKHVLEGREGKRKRPPLLQFNIRLAVIVMAHAVSQFARVATLPARLLMLTGRI